MINYSDIKNKELLRLFKNSVKSSDDLGDDEYFEIERYSFRQLEREVLFRMMKGGD